MESIYVLSMAKSHRTTNDKDLIRWEEDYAKIEGKVEKKTVQFFAVNHIEKGKKQN